jgi:hypothetical protein
VKVVAVVVVVTVVTVVKVVTMLAWAFCRQLTLPKEKLDQRPQLKHKTDPKNSEESQSSK